MKTQLKNTLLAPLPDLPIIVAAGIGPASLGSGISHEYMWLVLIIALMLQIVVFGRVTSRNVAGRTSSFWGILRENCVNFLIVALMIVIVGLLIRMIVYRFFSHHISTRVLLGIVQCVFAMLTIYVWPKIFLEKSSISALLSGIKYLIRNISSSYWILGIIVTGQLVRTVGVLVFHEYEAGWRLVVIIGIGFVVDVYLVVVSFAAALQVLMNDKQG